MVTGNVQNGIPTIPTNNARSAQPFPERLIERDVPVMQSKEDIATDTAAGDAERVATMIATASPKRGECAGDTEQILRNASTISVQLSIPLLSFRKDANSMQQKEGCVMYIPDRNAVRKVVNTMP